MRSSIVLALVLLIAPFAVAKSDESRAGLALEVYTAPDRGYGVTSTIVSTQGRDGFSTYGQTEWSLAAQQRFMAGLAAAVSPTEHPPSTSLA